MIEDNFRLLFASRAALFEFAFDDALFAFAYARPPLALALLFERPTTRHVVTIYLFCFAIPDSVKTPESMC